MSTKTEATIEDLYKVDGKAELVNGEIVHMSPTGGKPSLAARAILFSLYEYEKRTQRGYAVPDNAAFVVNLPHRKSISPDVAFYVGGEPTINSSKALPSSRLKFGARATTARRPSVRWRGSEQTTSRRARSWCGTLTY
jgi:Uma2 family endonuclease